MTVGLQSCSKFVPIATTMLQPCDNLGNGDEYTVTCSHFAIEIYTIKATIHGATLLLATVVTWL